MKVHSLSWRRWGRCPSATPEVLKDPSRLPCELPQALLRRQRRSNPERVDKEYTGLLEDAKSFVNRCQVCQLTSRLQHKICWQSTPTFAKWSTYLLHFHPQRFAFLFPFFYTPIAFCRDEYTLLRTSCSNLNFPKKVLETF
jgi:hypothetical protein